MSFNNRTALVTGAGRGIGKAIAETLAKQGVTVICVSKSAESCGAAAAAIVASGGKAKAYACDVADGVAVAKAAEALLSEFPVIDILVNNAGITRDGLLFRMSETDWNDVISTNLTSCFHWTKHLARPMTRARWGRIVNITSVSGIMGNAGQANYAAAKAGMDRIDEIARPRVRLEKRYCKCRSTRVYQNRYDDGICGKCRSLRKNPRYCSTQAIRRSR